MVILLDRIDKSAADRLAELSAGKINCLLSDSALKTAGEWQQLTMHPEFEGHDLLGRNITAIGIRGDSQIDAESAEVLHQGGIRLVVRFGSGVNNIDHAACAQYGIVVENVAGQNANGVAELVFGHLLVLQRNLNEVIALKTINSQPKKYKWQGFELAGKTLGVVGTGYIGSLVIQKAQGFGLKILAHETDTEKQILGITYVSLEELLRQSDIITLHIPKVAENLNLIDARRVEMMERKPIIVNCAREGLVDLDAIRAGLINGLVGGFTSDVDDENHPVFSIARTFVTPHIGAKTEESESRCALVGAEQIFAWLTQGQVKNGINATDILPRKKAGERIVILNRDVPGALESITANISKRGYNISFLENAGNKKSNLAVTLIDIDQEILPGDSLLVDLMTLEQVVRVFVI